MEAQLYTTSKVPLLSRVDLHPFLVQALSAFFTLGTLSASNAFVEAMSKINEMHNPNLENII